MENEPIDYYQNLYDLIILDMDYNGAFDSIIVIDSDDESD